MNKVLKLFSSNNKDVKISEIIREGYLEKESRFMKTWKKRWTVLTKDSLYTFENEKQYNNPTEIIDLSKIVVVRSDDDINHGFKVILKGETFYFKSQDNKNKEDWIKTIGSSWVKLVNKSIFIEEDDQSPVIA